MKSVNYYYGVDKKGNVHVVKRERERDNSRITGHGLEKYCTSKFGIKKLNNYQFTSMNISIQILGPF